MFWLAFIQSLFLALDSPHATNKLVKNYSLESTSLQLRLTKQENSDLASSNNLKNDEEQRNSAINLPENLTKNIDNIFWFIVGLLALNSLLHLRPRINTVSIEFKEGASFWHNSKEFEFKAVVTYRQNFILLKHLLFKHNPKINPKLIKSLVYSAIKDNLKTLTEKNSIIIDKSNKIHENFEKVFEVAHLSFINGVIEVYRKSEYINYFASETFNITTSDFNKIRAGINFWVKEASEQRSKSSNQESQNQESQNSDQELNISPDWLKSESLVVDCIKKIIEIEFYKDIKDFVKCNRLEVSNIHLDEIEKEVNKTCKSLGLEIKILSISNLVQDNYFKDRDYKIELDLVDDYAVRTLDSVKVDIEASIFVQPDDKGYDLVGNQDEDIQNLISTVQRDAEKTFRDKIQSISSEKLIGIDDAIKDFCKFKYDHLWINPLSPASISTPQDSINNNFISILSNALEQKLKKSNIQLKSLIIHKIDENSNYLNNENDCFDVRGIINRQIYIQNEQSKLDIYEFVREARINNLKNLCLPTVDTEDQVQKFTITSTFTDDLEFRSKDLQPISAEIGFIIELSDNNLSGLPANWILPDKSLDLDSIQDYFSKKIYLVMRKLIFEKDYQHWVSHPNIDIENKEIEWPKDILSNVGLKFNPLFINLQLNGVIPSTLELAVEVDLVDESAVRTSDLLKLDIESTFYIKATSSISPRKDLSEYMISTSQRCGEESLREVVSSQTLDQILNSGSALSTKKVSGIKSFKEALQESIANKLSTYHLELIDLCIHSIEENNLYLNNINDSIDIKGIENRTFIIEKSLDRINQFEIIREAKDASKQLSIQNKKHELEINEIEHQNDISKKIEKAKDDQITLSEEANDSLFESRIRIIQENNKAWILSEILPDLITRLPELSEVLKALTTQSSIFEQAHLYNFSDKDNLKDLAKLLNGNYSLDNVENLVSSFNRLLEGKSKKSGD